MEWFVWETPQLTVNQERTEEIKKKLDNTSDSIKWMENVDCVEYYTTYYTVIHSY